MSTFNAYAKLTNIEAMCRISIKNASPSAKAEVVGKFSERTLEDMLLGILALCKEAKDELLSEKTGMEA